MVNRNNDMSYPSTNNETPPPLDQEFVAQDDEAPVLDLSRSPSHLLYLARQRADEIMTGQLASIGMTPRQFTFLYAIYASPGLNQKDLSQSTGSDRSTVAELVSRLEKRSLLNRVRSTRDARSTILELTEQGVRDVKNALSRANAADEQVLAAMPPEHRETFLAVLSKIATMPSAE